MTQSYQQHLEELEKKFKEMFSFSKGEFDCTEIDERYENKWIPCEAGSLESFLRQSNIETVKWVIKMIEGYIIENAKSDVQTAVNVRMRLLLDEFNKVIE